MLVEDGIHWRDCLVSRMTSSLDPFFWGKGTSDQSEIHRGSRKLPNEAFDQISAHKSDPFGTYSNFQKNYVKFG